MDSQMLIDDITKLLKESTLCPEPHASFISKFLSSRCDDEMGQLVHICNSFGVNIRNSTIHPLHPKAKTDEGYAPVLCSDYLKNISSYAELLRRLENMPREWTVLQISKDVDLMDVIGSTKEHQNADPNLVICKLPCGPLAEHSIPPYFIRIPKGENNNTGSNVIQRIDELMHGRRECYSNPHDKNLLRIYQETDSILQNIVMEIERYCIREWKCLFSGRLLDENLEAKTRLKVRELLTELNVELAKDNKLADIVYHLAVNAHHMKDTEILRALNFALPPDVAGSDSCFSLVDDIKSINLRNSSALNKAEKHPVILIIDQCLELVPWEMTSMLTSQPVCRILSMHMLYAVFKYHEAHIVNGYRELSLDRGFCLLNPGKDLMGCEERMGNYFAKEQPWIDVLAGQAPNPRQLVNKLTDHQLFIYCGHGSGSPYLQSLFLKVSPVAGIVFLFGCSSNLPRGHGGRTPYQNDTYTYLTNGSPCIVGGLYDLSSTEADTVAIEVFKKLLPKQNEFRGVPCLGVEPKVLCAILEGKKQCQHYYTKCAFIARGIPVRVSRQKF